MDEDTNMKAKPSVENASQRRLPDLNDSGQESRTTQKKHGLQTMSPQKLPGAGVTNLDLIVDSEGANDVTLDQFIQAKHFDLEKDAGRTTYQSNLDASSKTLYSKIQIVPGPTKKGKQ